MDGSKGSLSINNFNSFRVLLPLDVLQSEHAVITFSHVVLPPFDLGNIWSKVKLFFALQYWHSNSSLRNTLKRVKAGFLEHMTYCLSAITLGIFIFIEGERTISLYSEITETFSKNTALILSF